MIVAGIMSGTSADGINVALVSLLHPSPCGRGRPRPRVFDPSNLSFKFVAQAEYPYPKAVRRAVLQAMNAAQVSVADLARLNFLLAELYAEAVLATQRRFRLKAELIGCHGQTLYHQGEPAKFLGRKLAVTWQTGEGAVIAARVGIPGRVRFPSGRHGRRRQRSAAGSLPRLPALSRSARSAASCKTSAGSRT